MKNSLETFQKYPEVKSTETPLATIDYVAPIIKSDVISEQDEETMMQIREKLGLMESEPLTIFEGISVNDFDATQLEIVRAFYKNRETRATVINPDLHLRKEHRTITKIGKFLRRISGRPEFVKDIKVQEGANFETRDDFSLDYFDVQYEIQPVISSIEKSVTEAVSSLTEQQRELRVIVQKKDAKTFIKKVFIDGQSVSIEEIPIESNTLWQALKEAKVEIILNRKNKSIKSDGYGGGESAGTRDRVNGTLANVSGSLEKLSSIVTHEYTHVHQAAVAPQSYEGAEDASDTYRGHATHPTEIQARVHEAITLARKHKVTFVVALGTVMEDYINRNPKKIKKEGETPESINALATPLHIDFFEKHYGQIKNLYPYL